MRMMTMMTMKRSKHRKMMMKNTTDKRLEKLQIKSFSMVDLNVEPVSKTIASKRKEKWVICQIIEADLVIDIQDNPAEEVEEVNVADFHAMVHEVAVIHVVDHVEEVIHEDEVAPVAVLLDVAVLLVDPVGVHEGVREVVREVAHAEELVVDQVVPSLRSH